MASVLHHIRHNQEAMKHTTNSQAKITRHGAGILALWLLSTAALAGATLTHDTGTTTYSQNFGNNSTLTINGGDATFTGTINTNSQVNVTGGSTLFSGILKNNVVFNLTGGSTTVNSVQNNATFNVDGGELSLNEQIGNGASVNVDSGSLSLGTNDVFANNTNVTMSGGTLNTGGNNVTFDSLTLTGDSTIDLSSPDGETTGTINVGTISGGGTVTFTGYTDTTQVQFDDNGSTVDVGSQVMFGNTPGMVTDDGTIIPAVPEPSTYLGGAFLVCFLIGFEIRRRRVKS